MLSAQGYHLLVRLKFPNCRISNRGKSPTGLPPNGVLTEESTKATAAAGASGSPPRSRLLSPRLFHRRPTLTATALFLLILSGPPRLRIRDPGASLRGEIDWVIILHIVAWTLAGLWVLLQMGKRFYRKRPILRLRLPQILGLALIACLSLSILKSAAPALTAFMVYQMLVCLLFTQLFVDRFGVRASLNAMLFGNVLICSSITICAFLAPNLVWTASDFNPDPSRLYGELIAPTGVVSVLAIILLLTVIRKPFKPLPMLLLALLFGLVVFSLMRTAYITAFVFFALVLLKRPNIKPLQRFTYLLLALVATLYAYGLFPSVSRFRSPETISTLSDRIGLWHYLTAVTLNQSPWFGLGYYSASRIHGPEYNPGLGTAHSIFFEALSGGGIPSFVLLTTLCLTLVAYTMRLLWGAQGRFSFAISTLFIATLLFAAMGDEIDSGPVAISFWCTAAILPQLYELHFKRTSQHVASGNYLAATPLNRV